MPFPLPTVNQFLTPTPTAIGCPFPIRLPSAFTLRIPAAMRVIRKSSGQWYPAIYGGRYVKSYKKQSILFGSQLLSQ